MSWLQLINKFYYIEWNEECEKIKKYIFLNDCLFYWTIALELKEKKIND